MEQILSTNDIVKTHSNGLMSLIIFYDGSREWYENNLLHNDDRDEMDY